MARRRTWRPGRLMPVFAAVAGALGLLGIWERARQAAE
eukprot:CAMPEP_0179255130 /NCGR_PEP_ID=MMETSP0797-20121207/23591_1 /TAXON_ID=47934 /ORGANISM="Dinophysis acuminata, Strain DAEP01" /LENGTH=37 /DNA_ID= /DNA_START= /DNA_END= /DNA_ORIENTATION=